MDAPSHAPLIVASYEDARRRGHALAPRVRPAEAGVDALYALRPKAIWAFLKTQPLSYWLICFYLFLEYVRPQNIYEWLEGPPWTQITLLAALGSFLFLEGGKIRLGTPIDTLVMAFSFIVLASSLGAWKPEASFAKFELFYSWVLIYLLITNIVSTEKRFLVFLFSFLIYSFKMSQHGTRSWAEGGFAFRDWGTTGAPGWFQNSGEFGIQMCIFVPLVVFFVTALNPHWGKIAKILMWTMLVTAVIGIVASSSRGALVGLAAVALWMLPRTRHPGRALMGTAALGLLVIMILPPEQKDRLREMGDDKTSDAREVYWRHGREIMDRYPVLGIGYENWADYHEANYGVRALSHNVFVQAGAELGYVGLGAFLALIGATLHVNRRTRRIAKALPGGNRFLHDSAHGLDGALV
ncbi:MAG TPA: O-antigen ligase family protein, partial [Longimicrobium sp.]|nr:O-antigen ligase family protein [Longimicrobium sp.]